MRKQINHILNSRKNKNIQNRNYLSVIQDIENLYKFNNHSLVLCLDNTGSSYLGVKNAVLNLFPTNTVIIPAYYSNPLISDKQILDLANHIVSLGFKQLVLGSFPHCFEKLALEIDKRIVVKTIFHGALSELHDCDKMKNFMDMINLCQSGVISRLGFVKSGLAQWSSSLFKIDACWLQLFSAKNLNKISKFKDGRIHIGVFGNSTFNKNITNQIAGALLVPNSVIHCFKSSQYFENLFDERIVLHDHMSHKDFLNLIGSMNLNLHLSFSEGMGGQTFTESISLGVPCLTSFNNEYLRKSDYLSDQLIVQQYDNPLEISKSIHAVLNLDLEEQLIQYSQLMNEEASLLRSAFLQ